MDWVVKRYYLECEWAARDDLVANWSAAAIKHIIATDHDIDSGRINYQPHYQPGDASTGR